MQDDRRKGEKVFFSPRFFSTNVLDVRQKCLPSMSKSTAVFSQKTYGMVSHRLISYKTFCVCECVFMSVWRHHQGKWEQQYQDEVRNDSNFFPLLAFSCLYQCFQSRLDHFVKQFGMLFVLLFVFFHGLSPPVLSLFCFVFDFWVRKFTYYVYYNSDAITASMFHGECMFLLHASCTSWMKAARWWWDGAVVKCVYGQYQP